MATAATQNCGHTQGISLTSLPRNIICIYYVYTWYIHGIYMVYHVLMLHLAADVAEEDRVPFHWLHQQ